MNMRRIGSMFATDRRVGTKRFLLAALAAVGLAVILGTGMWQSSGLGQQENAAKGAPPAGANASAAPPLQLPQADRPLAARFADPPAASRILKIIHPWPDDPATQDNLIRSLIGDGFGGVVCNVSFKKYLEDEDAWRALQRALTEAKKVGMAMWLYDERGYPSGRAGDITLRDHPELEARGLMCADAVTDGGQVQVALPPGKLFRATAYPESKDGIDLDQAVDLAAQVHDGKLTWQAPAGHWHVLAITEGVLYEYTHAVAGVAEHTPYINLLDRAATARFIEVTHQRYADHLGADMGKYFVSTFTDEPSLMNRFLKPGATYRALPWSSDLAQEFQKRRGYALGPIVPLLLAPSDARGQKERYDFWQTIGELVSENYFGQIRNWCDKHNVLSGGHLLQEEGLLDHVPFYGNFYLCARRLTAPGIDCITSLPSWNPWYIARLLSSVTELEGRTITMSENSSYMEAFGPFHKGPYNVSEEEIRGTLNRLMVSGINTITSYYGQTAKNISSEQWQRLNNWVGRISTMLTGGHQVTDIAVLYPIESVWPRFFPARFGPTDSSAAKKIQQTYDLVTDSLWSSVRDFSNPMFARWSSVPDDKRWSVMRDFTYIDAQALTQSKIERGALVHGNLRWRVLILPRADTLPLAAWENLARFWRKGGVVIAVGALPANSDREFPSPQVQALAKELFGTATAAHFNVNAAGGVGVFLPEGSEARLSEVLDALLEPDVKPSAPHSLLRSTHRHIDGHEVYFVINDRNTPWEGSIRLAATGPGEQWDPATGKMTPLAPGNEIKVQLGPYGAMLYRFPTARQPQRLKVSSGPLPSG